MYVYKQASGMFEHDETLLGVGYSGFGEMGKNKPAAERIHDVGPIPQGRYTIGYPEHHPRLGELAFPLTPAEGTATFGRSEFFIHGDSFEHPGEASRGCIILPHVERTTIAEWIAAHPADRELEVVPA